ncbi:ankrd29 [Symbiodinium sp. CCMP2592]|nr:ankrd29 [Symbiodinium sp. CCMP2592]
MGCSQKLPWLMFASVLALAGSSSWTVLEAIKNHKTIFPDKVLLEAVRTASDIDERDEKGLTALMWAARKADVEIVKAILLAGANVNLQSHYGKTALMFAAQYNEPEVVEAVLKHKPELNLQNKDGWTALIFAARFGKPEALEAILRRKPDLDLQERTGATALFRAVENKDSSAAMVKALLRAGAAVDVANFAGRTPLMQAAEWARVEAVEALLGHGSLPELRSRSGQNALDCARMKPENPLVQRLEEVTPKGMDLAKKYFASPTTWTFLGCGLAVGICAGSCLVAMGKRMKRGKRGSPESSRQVTVLTSSRRLAIKSLTKNIWKAETFRALELVACILLPFSMTMLWIGPLKFLPCYFLVYTLPALACWRQKALRFPAFLLVSPANRPGLLCPVRLPRAVATVAQLVSLYWLPRHCEDAIRYYMYGDMRLANATAAFPLNAMVRGPLPLLSRASAEMACPAFNHFSTEEKSLFFCVQYIVAVVSFIWVVLVTIDSCCGFTTQFSSDPQAVEQLSKRIAATGTKDEIAEINDPVVVSPERAIQCMPPGGIYINVGMVVCDVFLDLYSIYSCVMAAQLKFAFLMVAIVSTSCTVEALTAAAWSLPKQLEASLLRGLSSDALRHALECEACLEAPLSLCLTAYAFVFNVRGGGLLTLILSLMSIASSTYNTASYICWHIDLGLQVDEADDGFVRTEGYEHLTEAPAESEEGTSNVASEISASSESSAWLCWK